MNTHLQGKILGLPHLSIYDDDSITIEKFVGDRREEFFKEIEDRIWLYLDLNHWIGMRDALRFENNQVYFEFYEKLKKAVNDRIAICLISDIVLFELMSQSDQSSRSLTAKLITELTISFVITGLHELEPVLTRNSLSSAFQLNQLIYPIERILINKAPSILGIGVPIFKNPTLLKKQCMIQKKVFDAINRLSFSEMLEFGDQTGYPLRKKMESVVDFLNSNRHIHVQHQGNFEEIFHAEFSGIVDLLVDKALETSLLQDILKVYPLTKDMMKKTLTDVIHKKQKDNYHLLPDIILAKLYASVYFDKQMKFNSNHLNDFKHAAYALSYCDVFFTDGRFHRRLMQTPLRLNKKHKTCICSKPQELTNALAGIGDFA
ncbi:hypothetical protein [Leptospira kanakyensis]|uniref:hypothetical protein n=1 Tax=Leptospira kanakyensis TaxID=2484968 RepID=UPI00223E2C71|nr:hypothetical protein [Leptospira kanakyensis]MCW7480602.1 hypothetical protein [Leptospira kanakyensis]